MDAFEIRMSGLIPYNQDCAPVEANDETSSVQSKQIHVISGVANGLKTLSCEFCMVTNQFNFS